jgi:UDP-N-acetylmuramyl pentapeptide phosphotransferase/UDP-N-acetylglucosamine-1-phosphate transferase
MYRRRNVIAALPAELQIVPQVPWWIERAGFLLAGVWLVNLVNFMDSLDWMTVAEVVPVTGAILLLGVAGTVASLPALVAAALLGAIVGFAPFNRPVAQVFLGDVGSLPIGLLLGWLLLQLAATGHLAEALILPLYYLADATITLGRALPDARRSGRPIAPTSISALPTTHSRCRRSLLASLWSTWRLPVSRSLLSRPIMSACLWRC